MFIHRFIESNILPWTLIYTMPFKIYSIVSNVIESKSNSIVRSATAIAVK